MSKTKMGVYRSSLITHDSSLKFGLFGGSFDPVHNAHLALAQSALRELRLDRVFFVPAKTPPHKLGAALAPAKHRLAMLRLAVKSGPRFQVSPWELQQKGISYTERTLQAFQRRFPDAEWYLLIGGDSLMNITTWKRWYWLLAQSRAVVGLRRGVSLEGLHPGIRREVRFLKKRLPEISSTQIRQRIQQGRPLAGLVPPAVARYIQRHRLYAP